MQMSTYQQGTKMKVISGYALQQRLGSGSFATVYRGVRVEGQSGAEVVAIKAITRASEKLTEKVLRNLDIEISILRKYRHPNIVCMHDVQKTERHFYLILEYCGGGDVQRLIRTRKAGRLSERLTRRLMRDLASGLRFLWSQELIHRDIKPQNLLLTGPLPLDEVNDPEKTQEAEEHRKRANLPSSEFALKIADFGFARHLQTASLAETLCGSPLYMAPEILQHNRYDAKADLWSVGTVLFEMISGHPPFHGENHIDLLRNIQRKAVRLPPDVRVSKECVNLLRLLLNRNPLSRAGFREFFEACDAFVVLGCEGTPSEEPGSCRTHTATKDLGTIHENESSASAAESMITVATTAHQSNPQPIVTQTVQQAQEKTNPATPTSVKLVRAPHGLAPLQSSPPPSLGAPSNSSRIPQVPFLNMGGKALQQSPQPMQTPIAVDQSGRSFNPSNSSDESGFVLVERNTGYRTDPPTETSTVVANQAYRRQGAGVAKLEASPPASPYQNATNSLLSSRGEYMVVNDAATQRAHKGMLSTSPGSGGALMGWLSGRARLSDEASVGKMSPRKLKVDEAAKTLATAEDIGRRAVSVAHVGDSRAYLAMRAVLMNSSSLVSAAPMEGVEEERESNVALLGDSGRTEDMALTRRRSVSTDKTMPDTKIEDEDEVMPFAMVPETPAAVSAGMPSRASLSAYNRATTMSTSRHYTKPNPTLVRAHFGEALSCYLKALKMLKVALGAAQKVARDIGPDKPMHLTGTEQANLQKTQERIEITSNWLSAQFKGVLERADAANAEIRKLPSSQTLSDRNESIPLTSVEELIYNHSLTSGREGAVKHLLGQLDAARSAYRSAGLLAETLLMEPGVGTADRRVLEGYVDEFAARIMELDQLMSQQSRSVGSSPGSSSAVCRRGSSGVIGLIGPPPSPGMSPGGLRTGNNR